MGSPRLGVAFVFAGGDAPGADSLQRLPEPDMVIAADSGLHHALVLGCRVDAVVGDLDSADPDEVAAAVAAGAALERHPAAKDATDLELAIHAARARGCSRVVVIGGHGGRLGHFYANALLLASPEFAELRIEARIGNADVAVVRDEVDLHGEIGDLCTLLPVGGAATGVVTDGLRYALGGETLHPGSTRGVSNELVAARAHVSVTGGTLLTVQPHARRARR